MILFLISQLVNVYVFIIFIYVLMSWIPVRNGFIGDVYDALAKICDPYLDLFKKFIPPIGGVVDVSPIVAIIALELAMQLLYFLF